MFQYEEIQRSISRAYRANPNIFVFNPIGRLNEMVKMVWESQPASQSDLDEYAELVLMEFSSEPSASTRNESCS